jgi:Ca2+-binding EF-hand superfamily protein
VCAWGGSLQEQGARRNVLQTRCFTVVYGEGGRLQLNLAASSPDAKAAWVRGLTQVWKDRAAVDPLQVFLRKAWRNSDRNHDDRLSLPEVQRLLQRLNFNVSDLRPIKKAFADVDREGRGQLSYEQFTVFYKRLKFRSEVEKVFRQYARTNPAMLTIDELSEFLAVEQNERLSATEVPLSVCVCIHVCVPACVHVCVCVCVCV